MQAQRKRFSLTFQKFNLLGSYCQEMISLLTFNNICARHRNYYYDHYYYYFCNYSSFIDETIELETLNN